MIRDDCTYSNSPEESFSVVDEDGQPKERWTPLGANSSPEPALNRTKEEFHSEAGYTNSRAFSNLVLENERMNRALMALTSHFAQVQFRLGQVVNAESGCREDMLKSLEQFASRGIPDLHLCTPPSKSQSNNSDDYLSTLQPKPQKLIEELRTQLDELERFAYETGEQKEPPTQAMLGKQRLVLEELTRKLELDIKNLEQLSNDELMQVVDLAVHQVWLSESFVKVNEKLVEQLKTQIVDLERFIDFLHGSGACSDTLAKVLAEFKRTHQRHAVEPDSDAAAFETVSPGIQLGHSRHINTESNHINGAGVKNATRREYLNGRPVFSDKSSRDRTITLLQRAMAILHIFTSTQFGELADWKFHKKNGAKHTTSDTSRSSAAVERAKLQHWGTVRARLEVAVNVVLQKVNLLRSFQSEHFNRSFEQTSCIMKPTTSVDELDTSIYECRSVLAEKDRSRRPVRRSHTLSLHSDSIALGQTLGTKISLPVQRLHEANLRTMLDHGNPTCVTSAAYSSGLRTVRNSTSSGPNTVELDHTVSDTEEFLCSEAHRMVIKAVRRHLCPALRDLIEHGLLKKPLYSISEESSSLLQPRNFLLRPILGCFNSRKREPMEDGMDLVEEDTDYETQQIYSNTRKRSSHSKHSGPHAWHVLLKFYHLKHGQLYNESPARRLSESFDLDSFGGKTITLRQRFFNAMGIVMEAHTAYRRNEDSKFKAFVSIALNEGRLVPWLRLVLKHQPLVSSIYHPWSYTLSTGFDDALQSLNRLSKIEFNLPYDYSVRHLQEIRDAF
ncbi:hypothetical protein EG68_03003 [Paragonimus skrjabini miyazakii]|uniref:RUN domain-containing protein n=1 Tax=Paragonimus skrjabini miyazakii TaxID=59628 RepID=A0A8S9Z2K6_9TREM|nr:hypothetical protein EG68_03003 [Paragonimus skrjabini miyazakii]